MNWERRNLEYEFTLRIFCTYTLFALRLFFSLFVMYAALIYRLQVATALYIIVLAYC
jgi:hypothetical protein